MRYIAKNVNNTPQILTGFIQQQNNAGVNLNYGAFPNAEQLNNILRQEQRLICCYCTLRIDHFQGNSEGGSHNEHLEPQHGPHANPARQLDYTNIFACCNYSTGKQPSLQHCGIKKGHHLITDFLTNINCRQYFKYNVLGEIIPRGVYETQEDFQNNLYQLTPDQVNAFNTIQILGLNCNSLVKVRKDNIDIIIRLSGQLTRPQAQAKIQRINNENPFLPLVEMLIYYLNQVN